MQAALKKLVRSVPRLPVSSMANSLKSDWPQWFTHVVVWNLNEFNRNLLVMDLAEILIF